MLWCAIIETMKNPIETLKEMLIDMMNKREQNEFDLRSAIKSSREEIGYVPIEDIIKTLKEELDEEECQAIKEKL